MDINTLYVHFTISKTQKLVKHCAPHLTPVNFKVCIFFIHRPFSGLYPNKLFWVPQKPYFKTCYMQTCITLCLIMSG